MINLIKRFSEKRYSILILLVINFTVNVMVYLNTTAFREISEAAMIFAKLNVLLSGVKPALASGTGGYYYTASYVAFFFISIFGSLHSYFIFQCFLSTLTTYFVFRIVIMLSESKFAGVIAVLLITIYTEFLLISSVFYNQVYEIFFCALFLWLTLLLFREKKIMFSVVYVISVCLVVIASLLFRSTLFNTYYYFFAASVICLLLKYYHGFFKFLATAVILYILVVVLNPINFVREKTGPRVSKFFWGHTMYGGKGGENGFIYQENKDLFDKRLKEYVLNNKIDSINGDVIVDFQNSEVSRFIKEEPHRWVFLQLKKFFYTFGSIPQKDGMIMLMTGRISLHWIFCAAILQIPYALILILFILCIDHRIKSFINLSNYKFFVYLLGLYLITAICFYISFMERYRLVVFVMFFIPVIAVNLKKLEILRYRENRKELIIRLFFIGLIISIWIYQGYEAMILDADRYFKVVQ